MTLFDIEKEKLSSDSLSNIYAVYYCMLILDKRISLSDQKSSVFTLLNQCQQHLMEYYNNNYLSLTEQPHDFISHLQSIIIKMDESVIQHPQQRDLARKTKQYCLMELGRTITQGPEKMKTPLKSTMQVTNNPSSLRMLLSRNAVLTYVNQKITDSYHLFNFYLSPPTLDNNHKSQKIFIQARDGVILEALLVKNKQSLSNTVILLLVGHFQSEHQYLSESFDSFHRLFNNDIVFINHRNYSPRSGRFATSPYEIADDIVEFVNYFDQKRKNIILYGMCGGSAHMILAANRLTIKKIPFKLIVDRFFCQYSQSLDFKSTYRHHTYYKKYIAPKYDSLLLASFHEAKIMLFLLQFLLLSLLLKIILLAGNIKINFAEKIRLIPENDLLLLQARSKKCVGAIEPECTDLFVHPKNELRYSIKDRRQKNKIILKKLVTDCQQVAYLEIGTNEMQQIFLQLADCFKQYIQLIDNEKLTSDIKPLNCPLDLHSAKLYELTTRNKLPLQQFLGGFFAKPTQRCDTNIAALSAYAFTDILTAFNRLDPDPKSMTNFSKAEALNRLLTCVKEHESFICHVGNRLMATGLNNMNTILQTLLKTPLFTLLSKNASKQERLFIF